MIYPEKECLVCGNIFTPKLYNQIYCSKKCFIRGAQHRLSSIIQVKECNTCKSLHTIHGSSINRWKWCSDKCRLLDEDYQKRMKVYRKNWINNNPEKARETRKKTYIKNKNKISEKSKIYGKENRVKISERAKIWRHLNIERCRDYERKAINEVADSYVKHLLIRSKCGIKNPPPELIESKRDIIKLNRLVKQLKTKLNDKLESGKQ